VQSIRSDTFTEYSIYYGRISPIDEAKLVCYGGGRVEALRAQEGEWVKAGVSLAAIDSAKAIILLETATLQEKIALKNYHQTKKHLKEGNASRLALDQAHLAYLSAKSARIDAEKVYRGALAITPISGMVTYRSIQRYQELAPGFPTFSISKTSTMKVSIAIIESDAVQVSPGSKAIITTPLQPGKNWQGSVKSIAREATAQDRTFRAEIHISNPDGLLKIGSTAKVTIELKRHEDALCIPTEIIRTDGIQNSVMVVTDEGMAEQRSIIPGSQSDTKTMVTGGLTSGERIIISGYQLVTNGTPVRIVEK
jgi:RND family efflux transporter MFP subunit